MTRRMILSLDTETTLPSNAEPIPRLVSVAIAAGGDGRLWAAHDPDLPEVISDALDRHTLALHTAPFDLSVLLRWDPDLLIPILTAYHEGRIWDVMTRSKAIAAAEGTREKVFNLAAIVQRLCGEDLAKGEDTWRKHYGRLLGVDIEDWPEDARAYALLDAVWTHRACMEQEKIRQSHTGSDMFATLPDTARAHWALWWQTLRGIKTDQEQRARVDAEVSALMDDCWTTMEAGGLVKWVGKRNPKPKRDQKAAMAMIESMGVPITMTKRGPSLSKNALEDAHIPEGHPLDAYRRYGAAQTLRTSKLAIMARPVIRSRYNEFLVTGRTSASGPQGRTKLSKVEPREWVGTNIQNMPTPKAAPGFRQCLVARPGYLMAISDWGAIELGTFAQTALDLFGRSAYADMLREGLSPHTVFAEDILLGGAKYDPENPDHVTKRRLAKEWNFGRLGGMGDRKFGQLMAKKDPPIYMDPAEIKRVHGAWLERFPEVGLYFRYIKSLQNSAGWITVKVPRTGMICGRRSFTEACNLHFQSLASAIAKTALWELWLDMHARPSPLNGSWGLMFIHDENVSEVPLDKAEAACQKQTEIMIAAARHWCPDVPIGVDSHLSERYDK